MLLVSSLCYCQLCQPYVAEKIYLQSGSPASIQRPFSLRILLMSFSQSDDHIKIDPKLRPLSQDGSFLARGRPQIPVEPAPFFFHLSQKLNTPRARRANGLRLMGLLELRGAHRRKTLGFSLLLSPSLHSVCSAVPHPKLNPLQHQTASSFLTLKSRIRLLSWFYICRTANAPRAGTTNLSSSHLREHCQWQ